MDFTYIRTWSGFCYTAFVMDLYSRRIVGWSTSSRMDTDFVLSALEQAVWQPTGTVMGAASPGSCTTATTGRRADSSGGRNTARSGGSVGG